MEKNEKTIKDLFEKAMHYLIENFPPSPIEDGGITERRTMSTEFALNVLSGIADFDKNELAVRMDDCGYRMTYDEDLGDLVWVYYAQAED